MLINKRNNLTLEYGEFRYINGETFVLSRQTYGKNPKYVGVFEGRETYIAVYEKIGYDETFISVGLFVDREKSEIYAKRLICFNEKMEYIISHPDIDDLKIALGEVVVKDEERYLSEIKKKIEEAYSTWKIHETKSKLIIPELQNLRIGETRKKQIERLFDTFDIRMSRSVKWTRLHSDLIVETDKKTKAGFPVYISYELELSDKAHDYYVKLLKHYFVQRSVRFIVKDKNYRKYVKRFREFERLMNVKLPDVKFAKLSEYLSLGEQVFENKKDPVVR